MVGPVVEKKSRLSSERVCNTKRSPAKKKSDSKNGTAGFVSTIMPEVTVNELRPVMGTKVIFAQEVVCGVAHLSSEGPPDEVLQVEN